MTAGRGYGGGCGCSFGGYDGGVMRGCVVGGFIRVDVCFCGDD